MKRIIEVERKKRERKRYIEIISELSDRDNSILLDEDSLNVFKDRIKAKKSK